MPRKGPPSFDSIKAAAAGMGVPVDVLRTAKDEGAPGFRGSRVYPLELAPWLEKWLNKKPEIGAVEDKRTLELQKLKWQIKTVQLKYEVELGTLVEKSVFVSLLIQLVSEQKGLLRQKLESELPGLIPGLDPEQRAYVKQFCKGVTDDMCGRNQRLVDKWKV
jgi:hypothetical protein